MIGDIENEGIRALLREMGEADLSVLWAAVDTLGGEQDVNLTTTSGSSNDVLWTEMVKLGWMSIAAPDDLPAGSKLFTLHPQARAQLETLLATHAREAMPGIFNELCRTVPPMITKPVMAARGTPSDVALMLAGVVEATMRRFIKPDLHDEFLRAVADRAQDLRQQFKK